MKARYFAIAAAALVGAASLSSCKSNMLEPDQAQLVKTTYPKVIKVNVAGDTRAILEGNKPVWEAFSFGPYGPEGDQLIIASHNEAGEMTEAFYSCTDPEAGEFTLNESWGGWMNGDPVGPYVVTWATNSSCSVDVQLETVECSQPYGQMRTSLPGELDSAFMIGKTDDLSNVTLKNVMALLKFSIPEGSDINYVELNITGWSYANYVIGTDSWVYGSDDYAAIESNTVSYGNLFYADYQGLGPESVPSLEPGDYYFPVLPQTLAGTADVPAFTLSYSNVRYPRTIEVYPSLTGKSKFGAVSLEGGKIYDLGVISME